MCRKLRKQSQVRNDNKKARLTRLNWALGQKPLCHAFLPFLAPLRPFCFVLLLRTLLCVTTPALSFLFPVPCLVFGRHFAWNERSSSRWVFFISCGLCCFLHGACCYHPLLLEYYHNNLGYLLSNINLNLNRKEEAEGKQFFSQVVKCFGNIELLEHFP